MAGAAIAPSFKLIYMAEWSDLIADYIYCKALHYLSSSDCAMESDIGTVLIAIHRLFAIRWPNSPSSRVPFTILNFMSFGSSSYSFLCTLSVILPTEEFRSTQSEVIRQRKSVNNTFQEVPPFPVTVEEEIHLNWSVNVMRVKIKSKRFPHSSAVVRGTLYYFPPTQESRTQVHELCRKRKEIAGNDYYATESLK